MHIIDWITCCISQKIGSALVHDKMILKDFAKQVENIVPTNLVVPHQITHCALPLDDEYKL